jgi:DNA recombination protein RmuC
MDMVILLAVLVSGLVVVGLLLNRKLTQIEEKQKPSDELMQIINMLQEGSKEDRKVLLKSLQENTQALNERLDNAAKVIGAVRENLGEMSEIGRGMKELQEFLRSPKLRGNVGEQVLKELLTQFLPKQTYSFQYSFSSGEKVDAAIKTSAGIIPIDSKFPMENFQKMNAAETEKEKNKLKREFEKDVRKHIRDISKKYILTEEGTVDYALMYVPSEAVYYEIVNSREVFDYAGDKKVLPVSPSTFHAFISAILMSFEGQKIDKRAKEVLAAISSVQKDYNKVEDDLTTLQSHLNNAYNKMNSVLTSFTQLGQRITTTRSLGRSAEEDVKELKE